MVSGTKKLNFGHLGPEDVSSHKSRTLVVQTEPHFLKNHEMNTIKLSNLKK